MSRGAVALVTGGASGMGAAAAHRLSRDGARVVVVDIDGARAEAIAGGLPSNAIAVAADVSSERDVDDYTAAALTAFGRIDRVFLNAGIPGAPTPIAQESVATFDRVIAVNLRGVFLGLRAALRHMGERPGGGSVVVTASTAGLSGSDLSAYSAAKHGVVALVKSAAIEGARIGARVNAIAPGSIDTPMMRGLERLLGGGEPALRALHGTTPLGKQADRYGTADEIASLVAFLLGDEASWITGVTVPIDGGVLASDPYRLPELPA